MEKPKGPGGRPPGKQHPHRGFWYGSEQEGRWLNDWAREWDVSKAAAVRRLIREEAKRRGLE